MAVVGVIIIPDVAIQIVKPCRCVAALPQIAVAGGKTGFPVLEVTFVDGFKQFIYTIICLCSVAFDMEPQAAIVVTHSGPNSSALEQLIAE